MTESMKLADHTFEPWVTRDGKLVLASDAAWQEPLEWNRADSSVRPRVLVECDVFDDWQGPIRDSKGRQLLINDGDGADGNVYPVGVPVEDDWGGRELTMTDVRRRLFDLIDQTPNLDWILSTRWPENIRRMWPVPINGYDPGSDEYLRRDNVFLGTSISDQQTADTAVPELLKCRDLSPVLFLNIELTVPVDLGLSVATCDCCDRWPSRWISLPNDVHGDWPIGHTTKAPAGIYRASSNPHGALSVPATDGSMLGVRPHEMEAFGPIDWVLVGGGDEPCDVAWIEFIVEQCAAAGVPCWVKQLGSYASDRLDRYRPDEWPWGNLIIDDPKAPGRLRLAEPKGSDPAEWPEHIRVQQLPEVTR